MTKNTHEKHLRDAGRQNPPPGPDDLGGRTHALRAGKDGPTQRKSVQPHEAPTRDAGRDDRRDGSDSNRN
ncbi:hypothetical protein [Cognatilysobacter terrigena]|uniref:hypothetical protein n=1 Tax=Cognatilysobacter terrigena TaxID=2488749 RepID=UPI00105E9523|nr:hypothetical protein [Lysobacter terrigena]